MCRFAQAMHPYIPEASRFHETQVGCIFAKRQTILATTQLRSLLLSCGGHPESGKARTANNHNFRGFTNVRMYGIMNTLFLDPTSQPDPKTIIYLPHRELALQVYKVIVYL
ncbi:hypothetical protein BDV34DRAFT_188893 [Aspergillus parasiticus]|uniref:Uncharacterized protein n=1 Tax=Aspergillus parasiticus TaxID=5067 RepID=A0A5N6DWZ8_ASPPA|nr:hypothetical protein BDV34DRAFT_188893 [Aspergillus parasiticus]